MLIVHRLPEWPAAGAALVRLAVKLCGEEGLANSSKEVKAVCVDVWGTLTTQLFFEAKLAEDEAPGLAAMLGRLLHAQQWPLTH